MPQQQEGIAGGQRGEGSPPNAQFRGGEEPAVGFVAHHPSPAGRDRGQHLFDVLIGVAVMEIAPELILSVFSAPRPDIADCLKADPGNVPGCFCEYVSLFAKTNDRDVEVIYTRPACIYLLLACCRP